MKGVLTMAGALVLSAAIGACSGYDSSTPTQPGGASSPPADALVIDIVGQNGAQSFSPNPASIPAGRTVVWHNRDRDTHRIVLDDGRLDTGNIPPGAYSAAMTLPEATPYHCTIHPTMVGSLTVALQ